MPGTFSLPPRISDPDMHHDSCVTHVPWCMPESLTSSFYWSWWRGKRSRHSRRMRNPEFYVPGKRPIQTSTVLKYYKHIYSAQNRLTVKAYILWSLNKICGAIRINNWTLDQFHAWNCCTKGSSVLIDKEMSGFNTLRLGQNIRHCAVDMFKLIFVNENSSILIQISLKFIPRHQLTLEHWFI